MVSGVCFFISINDDNINESFDGDDLTLTVLPMVAILLLLFVTFRIIKNCQSATLIWIRYIA